MLQWPLYLLAANDGFGAVVFFLIWAIIIVVSQFQKWQEYKRKHQQNAPPPPSPVRLPSQQRFPMSQQPSAQQRPNLPKQAQRYPTTQTAPMQRSGPTKRPVLQRPGIQQRLRPIPPKPLRVPLPSPIAEATSTVAPPTIKSAGPEARMPRESATESTQTTRLAITASELSRAMRPNLLRRSFILTELIAPPMGLRDLQSAEGEIAHERTSKRPS